MNTIGRIVGGTLRLIAERPVSLLIWALAFIACGFIIALGFPFALRLLGADAPEFLARMRAGSIVDILLIVVPLYLVIYFLGAILVSAIYRTVLRPWDSLLGGLRIGMDEVRVYVMLLLLLLLWIAFFVVLVFFLPFLASAIGFASQGDGTVVHILGIALNLLLLFGMLALSIKLSIVLPTVFHFRRLTLDTGWELSRGRFWRLLAANIALWLIQAALVAAYLGPSFGRMFLVGFNAGDTPQAQAIANAHSALLGQQLQTNGLWLPMLVTLFIVMTLILVIGVGGAAVATRELLRERGELETSPEAF